MDNNIALITALFNEKGANFYKDIYFPIIRYSLIGMFYEHDGNDVYFKVKDLQDYIRNKFYIEIPVVVLRNSVVALKGSTQSDIVVKDTFGKNDDGIYITRIVDYEENRAIDREAEKIEDNFTLLENLFQQYLAAEHLDSNTNLYDFISECEEECYAMIAGNNASQSEGIDANYSNTARFIDWLKINRTDLYQYFEDIVWGSVISAFLRRKQLEISIKPNDKVSYYLDSALVLALFNLDTEYNVAYARDVMRHVRASGGDLKVHSMTIREVYRILSSVISDQGPRFGSAISFGFEENELSLSDLVSLRNSLESRLSNEFGIAVESYNQRLLDEEERKLDNNNIVLYLKEKWGGYTSDTFREKHDVFMCETVTKKNHGAFHPEKMTAFFVTLNRDLIELYHKTGGMSSVITPGTVVLKLWIHGAQIADVKGEVLTEMLSRCLALSQTDARRKIRLFVKCRKGAELPPQDVKDMYSSLIHRSNNIIMKFEELEKLESSETDNKDDAVAVMTTGLMEAVHEDAEQRHKLYNDSLAGQKMQEDMAQMERELKAIIEAKEVGEKVISKLQKENADNKLLINQLQKEMARKKKENELETKYSLLQKQKDDMENMRNESISTVSFWIILFLDIVLLLAIIIFSIILFKSYYNHKAITLDLKNILAAVSFLGFLFRVRDAYWLKPFLKYSQCKKDQTDYWENQHPEYIVIKNQMLEIERDLKALKFKKNNK